MIPFYVPVPIPRWRDYGGEGLGFEFTWLHLVALLIWMVGLAAAWWLIRFVTDLVAEVRQAKRDAKVYDKVMTEHREALARAMKAVAEGERWPSYRDAHRDPGRPGDR